MKVFIALLMLFTITAYADDLTIDNADSIGMSNGGNAGSILTDSKWSFDGFKQAITKSKGCSGGYNGFLGYFLTDSPLSLDDYRQEYRDTSGGPVSSFFGFSPYKLQNGLVKAFMGLLLLLFVGAAVIAGMNKVSTGQGDFNYVSLAIKFIIGIIVVFHPDFIYGMGRSAQTGSLYVLRAVVGGMGESFQKGLKQGDVLANSAQNVINESLYSQMSNLSTHLMKNADTAAKIYPHLQAYNNSLANTSPTLPSVELPSPSGTSGEDQMIAESSLKTAYQNFPDAVGNNKDFLSQVEPLKAEFEKRMAAGEDPVKVQADFKGKVDSIAMKVGKTVYAIDVPFDGFAVFGAMVQNMTTKFNDALKWSGTIIGNLIIPVIAWIILRISAFCLEIGVVVVVFTFPLWFLDSTKKAFLGSWNSIVTAAIVPTVAVILLSVFEGVMACVYKVVCSTPLTFLAGQTVYIIAWILGAAVIAWKSPKVTKAIFEGSSIVGMAMGTMVTTAVGSGLALAGIGAVVASGGTALAGMGGTAAAGTASGAGSAAGGAASGAGKALGGVASGAGEVLAGGGAFAPVGASSGNMVVGTPDLAGSSSQTLGNQKQAQAAASTEARIQQKRVKPASVANTGGVGGTGGTVGTGSTPSGGNAGSSAGLPYKTTPRVQATPPPLPWEPARFSSTAPKPAQSKIKFPSVTGKHFSEAAKIMKTADQMAHEAHPEIRIFT